MTAPAKAATPTTPAPPSHGQFSIPAACNTGDAEADRADDSSTPYARCFAEGRATKSGDLAQQQDEPLPTSLGPADIRSAYHLPDGGADQTVAIVDAFGYDNAESDLAVFRAYYGLPPCTTDNGCFTKVDQRGGTDYPVEEPGWSIETALDLDAVSSACPKCHILLVQADDNASPNLGKAVDTAAAMGAVAISNSYGIAGELPFESYYDHYYDHPGIAVTVSSGDYGNVSSYPATSPDVISVGGTTLTRDPDTERGWTETAWDSGGSGCSRYEPRPDYQAAVETGCPDTRATADVAADADSDTGLAVYNTLGQDGWAQWGGTSLASPLVAAMYALAGDPVPDTYPVSYLYRDGLSLNDVTEGSQGPCGDVRCNAGPGWDGPTGAGTPDGVSALTLGPAGAVTGRVMADHRPLAGADLTLIDSTGYRYHAVSDARGRYDVSVAAGSYRVVASKFGYDSSTVDRLVVTAGRTASRSFDLDELPTRTLTGTVSDGSGQGWPIYAEITIQGYPGRPVHTDPYTGRYSVELPVGSTYKLSTKPVDMPGYLARQTDVAVGRGSGAIRRDVGLQVDPETCTAAGYAYAYAGAGTDFEGWTSPQGDWSVTDEAGTGKTWVFNDPGSKGNLTGGSGQFAIVDNWQFPATHDTSLVTPALDLSDQSNPEIGFDTYYYDYGFGEQDGDVDLSLDGGTTWQNVWHAPDAFVQGHVDIPVPQAAGKTGVLVRFRFTGRYDNYWELDNVFAGARLCKPVEGGLVAGVVRDDNTGAPLTGSEVTAEGGTPSVSQSTPDDARVADGYYWFYSKDTGPVSLAASGRNYADSSASVTVASHRVVRHDWRLRAGELTVNHGSLDVRTSGGATTRTVTLRNTGTEPVQVDVAEEDRGFTPVGGHGRTTSPGAPLQRVQVDASPFAFEGKGGDADPPSRDVSANPAWSNLPDFPTPIMDNVVAQDDGILYSVSGLDDSGMTGNGYAFDPDQHAWRPIAPLPVARENAVGGFVDGKLYVAGGWDPTGTPTRTTYAYDPTRDTWSRVADLPGPKSVAASAVWGGHLYVVAGCGNGACDEATATYRYDPRSDSWSQLADYPQDVVMLGCAGSGDGLICAGGTDPLADNPTAAAYQYVAGSDAWTRVADLPYTSWGMSYAGSGGKLQLVGGVVHFAVTNQAIEFDPATGEWSELPNATYSTYRGGAACGLARIGGSIGSFTASPYSESLAGQHACLTGADVGWLSLDRSEVTIPPGRTVTVRVRFDGAATSTPGTYVARLAFATDTPYSVKPVEVTLTRR